MADIFSHRRANSFLDQVNDGFFKPRGLYCLIMTYKPESSDTHGCVNMMKSLSSSSSSFFSKLRVSSGKTHGELELPQAAPLIFPALDAAAEEGARKKNRMKETSKFVADYMDRRAQATYAGENPGSALALATTEPRFRSRFADPNHAASSGDLVALVTGGAVDMRSRQGGLGGLLGKLPLGRGGGGGGGGLQGVLSDRFGRQGALGGRFGRGSQDYERQNVIQERFGGGRGRGTGGRDSGGFVKKIIQKDVLYMMIVNLPSEEEMQAGVQAVANQPPR
ncbi:hypothetical protein LARI1_G008983 [Lachnellula arida]|uniref:Uncharacterized protein n=1 Tax=Lachnellula arida TaxID=1316785 RepID=A0A8T9B0I1_9HELO|nr:hypothetical protein LARI1_G008983 [Lachnellula arida]